MFRFHLRAFSHERLSQCGVGDGADGTQNPTRSLVNELHRVFGEQRCLAAAVSESILDVAERFFLGEAVQ